MELLSIGNIKLDVVCNHCHQAIQEAGELLLKSGYVTADYIKAMIDNLKINGPYFVLAPGIAIAHARPENGVLEEGLSLIRLKEAVPFGSAANDPVSVVMALAAKNSDEHVAFIGKIAAVLTSGRFLQDIAGAQTEEEVCSLFTV